MKNPSTRIADAIERLYAELPPETFESVDRLRDEIAHALAFGGLTDTTSFIERANTRRTFRPER
jgi:hypothetical protein